MRRRPFVSVIAGLCGIAIGVGAWMPWIGARGSRPASGIGHTALTGLSHWSYQNSGFFTSFAIAVAACGLLVLLGAMAGSRVITAFFSLIALAAAGLWIGLDASHYHSATLPYSDLRLGAWLTLGGGLIGLIAGIVLRKSADS